MTSRVYAFVFLAVLCACSPKESTHDFGLPFYLQADFTPEWIDEKDPEYAEIHTVGSFSLLNQDGDIVTEETVKGKIYVANFFFTICPTVCPRMTRNLHRVEEAFAQDTSVLLVSHTVMPWVDSVAVLREFAEREGIRSTKWHLLTGEKKALYTLGRQSYFADEGFGKTVTEESDFLHTENIVLVDPQLRIRGVYNGTLPLEMTRLIEDIERLKEETVSSEG